MSLKVTKDGTKGVLAAITSLERSQVLVGVPAAHAERQIDPEEPRGPINNAAIGYIMENGSPAANIPARPHLKRGIADVRPELVKRYRDGTKKILDGKSKDPNVLHHQVGLIAERGVKARINEGDFAPLSERTLAARRARGRKSEKPLVDTGQYRNSITHVIRPKR